MFCSFSVNMRFDIIQNMMNRVLKTIYTLMLTAVLVTVLASCGGSKAGGTSRNTSDNAASEVITDSNSESENPQVSGVAADVPGGPQGMGGAQGPEGAGEAGKKTEAALDITAGAAKDMAEASDPAGTGEPAMMQVHSDSNASSRNPNETDNVEISRNSAAAEGGGTVSGESVSDRKVPDQEVSDQSAEEGDETEDDLSRSAAGTFTSEPIPDSVFARMSGVSYPADCPISRDDLRYLRLSYYDFNGNPQVGELVCNKSIAKDLIEIFTELYNRKYQIDKIRLIDDYGGDDDLSCADNNTSCFNFRTVSGSSNLSKHAMGVAIDINPFYNPYVTYPDGKIRISPPGSEPYGDRSADFPHKIGPGDDAYELFKAHGFTWGGNWKTLKDYQHFQKPQ